MGFKLKPEIYLDLSLDGKPCGRVLLRENSTIIGANLASRALKRYKGQDEQTAKAKRIRLVNFSYSSRLLPTQEVDHGLGFNYVEAYLCPGGVRGDTFAVVFTHMHFLNRSYPVKGHAVEGNEALWKIYKSTGPIEITDCGEIPQDDLELVPLLCYPVHSLGHKGGIGPHIKMCYPPPRLGLKGIGKRNVVPDCVRIAHGETPESLANSVVKGRKDNTAKRSNSDPEFYPFKAIKTDKGEKKLTDKSVVSSSGAEI